MHESRHLKDSRWLQNPLQFPAVLGDERKWKKPRKEKVRLHLIRFVAKKDSLLINNHSTLLQFITQEQLRDKLIHFV